MNLDPGLTTSRLSGGELLKRLLQDDPLALLRVLDEPTTIQVIGVSERTWDRLRAAGDTPPITILSARRVGYRVIDVAQWLDARRKTQAEDHDRRLRAPRRKAEEAAV